jgi:hypothetical protein
MLQVIALFMIRKKLLLVQVGPQPLAQIRRFIGLETQSNESALNYSYILPSSMALLPQ